MIQGLVIHAGLTFNATLTASKTALRAEDADWDLERVHDGFFIKRGKPGKYSAGRARIYPFCIKMKGIVTVTGAGALAHWKLGFIQSILTSTRVARYAQGPPVAGRQNPVSLPVIDRDESTEYFYVAPDDVALGNNTVKMTDEPNHEFVLVKTGHALIEALEDTEFLTFLAARNTNTQDILVLGGYRWRACYRATYRNGQFTTWLANRAAFEPHYARVAQHVIPGAGGMHIGNDVVAAENNFQTLDGDQWVDEDDDD